MTNKFYEFTQINGNSTFCTIITKPEFENGILKSFQVAQTNGFDQNGQIKYVLIDEPLEFMAAGNYTILEYRGQLERKMTQEQESVMSSFR